MDVETLIKRKLKAQQEWLRARERKIGREPQPKGKHRPLERGEAKRREQRRQERLARSLLRRPILRGV